MELTNDAVQEALDAHGKVKDTITALRARHGEVTAGINGAAEELRQLATRPLPKADMQAMMADGLHDAAMQVALRKTREVISSLSADEHGHNTHHRPLPFDKAMRRFGKNAGVELSEGQITKLLSPEVIYCLCGDVIRERLAGVVQSMADHEMGYHGLTGGQIGPDREKRAQLADKARTRMDSLEKERQQIVAKLDAFGVTVWGHKHG